MSKMTAGVWLKLAPAALLALLWASPAPAAPVRPRPAAGLLLPLSNADSDRAESGCSCTFGIRHGRRDSDFLLLSGHSLLFRTRSGLNICRVSDPQFEALSGPGGTIACGGDRITIRHARQRDLGNDMWASNATVTVTRQGRRHSLRGAWACAC